MSTETKEVKAEPKFTPLHVNAHGYDSPYLVKAFIEDESGKPVCGLYEGDGAHARLFAAAPALYEALSNLAFSYDARDAGDPCWCRIENDETHFERVGEHDEWCLAARDAFASVSGPQAKE